MPRASSFLLVGAGLALLGLGTRAEAGELFRKFSGHCDSSCGSQTIQLPAQKVVVETARPRVVVEETRVRERLPRVARVEAPPTVASFFVPMPLQLGVVSQPFTQTIIEEERERPQTFSLDSPGLRCTQELERRQLQMEKLQAIHEAEYRHTTDKLQALREAEQRHMQRMMDRLSAPREKAPLPKAEAPGTDKCCEEVKEQLRNLLSRVEQLEQQVIYHDRVIRGDPSVKTPPPK
jgi:hypothetical protein